MPTCDVTVYGTWSTTSRVELGQDTDLGEDAIEFSTLSEEAPA